MTAKFREISGLYHDNGELASAGSPFFMPTGGLDRAPRPFEAEGDDGGGGPRLSPYSLGFHSGDGQDRLRGSESGLSPENG